MKYISMYKIHFTQSDKSESIYKERYDSPSTLHFDISIFQQKTFVVVTNEMLSLIEDIYYLNNKVIEKTVINKKVPPLIRASFVKYALIDELRMSNEIEGLTSTRKEFKDLLNVSQPKKYFRFYGLVNKYRQLIKQKIYIKDVYELRALYDKTLLQDVEKENKHNIPDGEIFRKEQVEIDSGTKVIHEGIMPEKAIIDTMDQALIILNNQDISLLVRVAVFHYLFGYIHPFYDGNGRMDRFISSAYLRHKLDILSSLQLSISCKENQKLYYEAFKITNDPRNKADLTYFVLTFLEILKQGLESLNETIVETIQQYLYYNDIIKTLYTKEKQYRVMDVLLQATLFDSDGITISNICELTHISRVTLIKYFASKSFDCVEVNTEHKSYSYYINLNTLETHKT